MSQEQTFDYTQISRFSFMEGSALVQFYLPKELIATALDLHENCPPAHFELSASADACALYTFIAAWVDCAERTVKRLKECIRATAWAFASDDRKPEKAVDLADRITLMHLQAALAISKLLESEIAMLTPVAAKRTPGMDRALLEATLKAAAGV